MKELVNTLALSLNQPFGLNMNIGYHTLFNTNIFELENFIKIIEKFDEEAKKRKGK